MACSEDEAQQQFREEALSAPAGITEMTVNGNPVENGETDSSDWRTAPDFSGLFEVFTPAYPNPISFNEELEITFDVKVLDAFNGMFVYAFQQPSNLIGPIYQQQGQLNQGLETIQLRPEQFASPAGTGTIGNTYRIIFFDSRQKVITYGDVLVE